MAQASQEYINFISTNSTVYDFLFVLSSAGACLLGTMNGNKLVHSTGHSSCVHTCLLLPLCTLGYTGMCCTFISTLVLAISTWFTQLGIGTRFSTSGFFHAVSNFFKNSHSIRSSRCTAGVIDTGGKWKKSSIIKVSIILFGHLQEVELTYR